MNQIFESNALAPTDALIDVASRYQQAKPWSRFHELDIFVLRFSDNMTGLISVMGKNDADNALSVFLGDDMYSFFDAAYGSPDDDPDEESFWKHRLDCLQLVIGEEAAAPYYRKSIQFHQPWYIESETQYRYIQEAAQAVLLVLQTIGDNPLSTIGIERYNEEMMDIPRFRVTDGALQPDGREDLLFPDKKMYPVPNLPQGPAIERLKKRPAKGAIACRLICSPFSRQDPDHEEEAPVFPVVLFTTDVQSGRMLTPCLTTQYEGNPDDLVNQLVEALRVEKRRPKRIQVMSRRAGMLLSPLAKALDAKVEMVSRMPVLNEDLEKLSELFL